MSSARESDGLLGLPAGYRLVRRQGLRALVCENRCVCVFSCGVGEREIVVAAARDAADRVGISARDLRVALDILQGEPLDAVARR
jgi:hypothetical protein